MAYLSPQARIVMQRKQLERRALLESKQGASAVRQLKRSFMKPHDYQQGFQRYKTVAFTPQALPKQYRIRKKRGKYTPSVLATGKGSTGWYGSAAGRSSFRLHKSGPRRVREDHTKILKAQAGVRETSPHGIWTTSGYMKPRGWQSLTTRQNQLLTEKIKQQKKKKEFFGLAPTGGMPGFGGMGWKNRPGGGTR